MRLLMRITPDVVATAREYLEFEANGYVADTHLGNLFPIHPERILKIWDAHLEVRPGQMPPRALLVLKDGSVIREVNHVKGFKGENWQRKRLQVAAKYIVDRLPAEIVQAEGWAQNRHQLEVAVQMILELSPKKSSLDDVVALICGEQQRSQC